MSTGGGAGYIAGGVAARMMPRCPLDRVGIEVLVPYARPYVNPAGLYLLLAQSMNSAGEIVVLGDTEKGVRIFRLLPKRKQADSLSKTGACSSGVWDSSTIPRSLLSRAAKST
jgi:hypothetical protein